MNTQHDCISFECDPFRREAQRQERQDSERWSLRVQHKENKTFIVNLLSLHNSTLLRSALPSELTKPLDPVPDRADHRRRCANKLNDETAKRAAEKAERHRKALRRASRPGAPNNEAVGALREEGSGGFPGGLEEEFEEGMEVERDGDTEMTISELGQLANSSREATQDNHGLAQAHQLHRLSAVPRSVKGPRRRQINI